MRWLFICAFVILTSTPAGAQKKEAVDHAAHIWLGETPDKPMPPVVTVRKLIITGNDITTRQVIVREMSIREGSAVISDSIAEVLIQNKLRLINLSLFDNIKIWAQRINNGEIDIYIDLKERWFVIPSFVIQLADRNFNSWWVEENHDIRRTSIGLTLTDPNFLGRLETLAATVEDGYTQKLGISYSLPYLDHAQKKGIGFSIAYSESRQTFYKTDSDKLVYTGSYSGPPIYREFDAGARFIYRPAYATRHIFQINYRNYSIAQSVVNLNPYFFSNSASRASYLELYYRMDYNGVDNWNYPLSGIKFVGQAAVRTGFQGMHFESYSNVEAGIFRNPLPKWYVSAIFRGRLLLPQKQPYFFQSGLGTTTDYVRGYEYYIIDGGQYGLLRFDLKREIFNRVYPLPIRHFTAFPLRIYPKIFADAGAINSAGDAPEVTSQNNFLSNKLLYCAGVGVDIVTVYDVKIRLEYAVNRMSRAGLYLHTNSE